MELPAIKILRIVLSTAVLFGTNPVIAGQTEGDSDSSPAIAPRLVYDVAMKSDRTVEFSVLNAAGKPIAGETVQITFNSLTVATAKSDAQGKIVVRELRPGLHTVNTRTSVSAYRFWDATTAPPNAVSNPAIVPDIEQLRGQYASPMMGPALLATGIAATAIAIVLIGKNNSDNHQPVPASP